MKMRTIASRSASRSVGAAVSCAFAAHTNADHAHQTRARTSIERPKPAHVRSWASSAVTCVTAKTKTRSQRSSTGLVRRSIGRSIAEGQRRPATRYRGRSDGADEPGALARELGYLLLEPHCALLERLARHLGVAVRARAPGASPDV